MARPHASTSAHGPSATGAAEPPPKAKRQPLRKCSVARKKLPGAMPSRSLSPVRRRRLRSEDTDPSDSRAPKPAPTAIASQAAPSAIDADLMTKAHILNSLTDPFWRTVISTPLNSREQAEEAAGHLLTSAEHQCWTSLAAIRPVLLGNSGLFFTPSQIPDIWIRKALLKSNIASLFVTLLTTPSELGSKAIALFISQLIINKEFATKTCVKIFVEFLAEFELQKWLVASLGKTTQSIRSFLAQSPTPHFALQDYVEYLTGDQNLQVNFEPTTTKAFKDAFEVAYADSLGRKPDEVEVKVSYSEFLGSIIDLICQEFPELAEPPASIYRLTKTRTSQLARSLSQVRDHQKPSADRLAVTRGEGDEEHDQDKSDSRSRSASQSFQIDTLRPTESESQIDDDGQKEPYSGPCAGSPEARHHENVAGEVAANANIFIGFSRELGKSSNGFSDRRSHSVSGLPDEGENLKEQRSFPGKKFDFTRRQPDASQVSWSETLVVPPERRSDDGETWSEASAVAGQKDEPLSPNIHAELELRQANSTESELSSEQKLEEPAKEGQPGIGSPASSHAPQRQRPRLNESIRFPIRQENPTEHGKPPQARDLPTVSESGSLDPKSVAPWEIFLGMEQGAERQNECGTNERAPVKSAELPVAVGNDRLGNQQQHDERNGPSPQHPNPDRPPSERTAADLDRIEEEGTRTVRPQDRQRPGLGSKLESPVERHHRNLQEKKKQVVSQASTSKHKMSRVAGAKLKRPLNEFETDSESDDTLGRGGENHNNQARTGSVARTKKDEIDGGPRVEGSETTRLGAKQPRALDHSEKAVSASDKTDDERREKDRMLKKRKRRDDGGKARQRTPSNEHRQTGDKSTGKSSKPKREDTMVESDESSPTNRVSSISKKRTASRASPVTGRRRQAWTEEQEDLLIKEVIRFSGKMYNCMAYILQRHGTGGTESHVLANRTNVMLKDKAVQITTKWAREGKRLSKKTLDAFARFPPKSGGVLLGLTPEEEKARHETVEERKRSRSGRAESCANGGHESGAEPKEVVGNRVSPTESARSWTSLSPLPESAFLLISENPRAGDPSGDGDIGTCERNQVSALTPQQKIKASDDEDANAASSLGAIRTPVS